MQRVEVGELLVPDPAREADAAVEPVGERFEALAVRPVADDDRVEHRLALRRLDQQVDPFRAVEPVDREHEPL